MALCVTLQPDGTLVATGEAVEACSGYVLVSGSEYEFNAVINKAFDVPTPEIATAWFVGALGAVMFWYIVSRIAGSVVAMFK